MTIQLNLTKEPGMILNLTKAAPALNILRGDLDWEPHPVNANCKKSGFDLDIFVISLNANGKIETGDDIVYFNNKFNANNSITVPVDNQTGEGEDDEFFTIDTRIVRADRPQHEVFVFLHEADLRKQNFGMIASAKFAISDADTGVAIVEYSLNQNYGSATALHVGSLVCGPNGNEFHPVGVGATLDPQQVINMYM